MKKVATLIVLSLLVISACIIYLVYSGISLRPAQLIKPSVMSPDKSNVASSLVLRLFQELQSTHYILWGVIPETEESRKILDQAAKEYEKVFHKSVQFIRDAENVSPEILLACMKPCWLLVSKKNANQLEINNFIEKQLNPLQRVFISLTIISFQGNEVVSDECNSQKKLKLNCLIPVSIREVQRKMKDTSKSYFFLNRYNEKDYFLFIQQNS